MIIKLYVNSSENNKINKRLTEVTELNGSLRTPASLLNPTIEVAGIDSLAATVNYAYIPQFNRYYYITGVSFEATGLVRLDMAVDVLMSHASQIMNQNAVIERQEFDFNMELRDTNIPTYNGTLIQYQLFPNGFTDYQIVIPILGN